MFSQYSIWYILFFELKAKLWSSISLIIDKQNFFTISKVKMDEDEGRNTKLNTWIQISSLTLLDDFSEVVFHAISCRLIEK